MIMDIINTQFYNSDLYKNITKDIKDWLSDFRNNVFTLCGCPFLERYKICKLSDNETDYFCQKCNHITIIFKYNPTSPFFRLRLDKTKNEIYEFVLHSNIPGNRQIIFKNKNNGISMDERNYYSNIDIEITENMNNVQDLYMYCKSRMLSQMESEFAKFVIQEHYEKLPNLLSLQQLLDDINSNKEPDEIIIEI